MGDTAEDAKHVSQKRPLLAMSLMDSSEPEPTSRVLVIYTGGTIGMKTNNNGGLEKN
jgi:L-asparaginase/Glu-tRNA(Gln) amidotransferase subunit D